MKAERRRSPWWGAALVLAVGLGAVVLWPARSPRVLPPRPQPEIHLERTSEVVLDQGAFHAVYRLTNLESEPIAFGVLAVESLGEDGKWRGPRGPLGPAFTRWNYSLDAGESQGFTVRATNVLDRPWRVPLVVSYPPGKRNWLEAIGILRPPQQSGNTAWIISGEVENLSEDSDSR